MEMIRNVGRAHAPSHLRSLVEMAVVDGCGSHGSLARMAGSATPTCRSGMAVPGLHRSRKENQLVNNLGSVFRSPIARSGRKKGQKRDEKVKVGQFTRSL